jgi:predicted Rossmann-fold nucleotide-binding protein
MVKTFCFYGSSKSEISDIYIELVEKTLEYIFSHYKQIRIVTGGYSGFMELVCEKAKSLAQNKFSEISLENYGIIFEGYEEIPNAFLDKTISVTNLGERVHTMIEISDFIFAFDGSNGTLHEILQTEQTLKYSELKKNKRFWIHQIWEDRLKPFDLEVDYFDINSVDKLNIFSLNDTLKSSSEFNDSSDILESINNLISASLKENRDAFDFAYTFFNSSLGINEGMNRSFAINEYSNILNDFLNLHNSLLNCNVNFNGYNILNGNSNSKINDLEESNIKLKRNLFNEYQNNPQISFDKWNKHLATKNFGKVSFWINKHLLINEIEVNLSCFLVLDIELSKEKYEKIIVLLNNYIFKSAIEDILEKIKLKLNEIHSLDRFRKKARAHQHTIFNLLSTTEILIASSQQISNKYNDEKLSLNLSNALGIFKTYDICFQAIFDCLNKGHYLYGKTIDCYVKYILDCYKDFDFGVEEPIFDITDETHLQPIKKEMPEVFMILWNLWHNAYSKKESGTKILIKMVQFNDFFYITFSNHVRNDLLDKAHKVSDYLTGRKNEVLKENGGLTIIKQTIEEVKFISIDPNLTKIESNTLHITLKIN